MTRRGCTPANLPESGSVDLDGVVSLALAIRPAWTRALADTIWLAADLHAAEKLQLRACEGHEPAKRSTSRTAS